MLTARYAILAVMNQIDEYWQPSDNASVIVEPMTELPNVYRFEVPGTFTTDRGTLMPDDGGWIITWDAEDVDDVYNPRSYVSPAGVVTI